MRMRIILLVIAGLLFGLGLFVKHARGEDAPPRQAYLGVNVKKDSTVVVNVMPGSPAYKAGVRPGDVITSFHREPVHNDIELLNIMLSRQPGEKISVAVLRTLTQGLAFNITLVERTQEIFKTLPRFNILEWSVPSKTSNQPANVTVLYFTATWCAPCKQLDPHIKKVYRQFKNNPRLSFMAVAITDDENDREEYKALVKLQHHGHYPFTVIRDATIWKNLGVETVPTVIIANQRGDIVGEYHGNDLLPDKCATLIKELTLLLVNPYTGDLAWL